MEQHPSRETHPVLVGLIIAVVTAVLSAGITYAITSKQIHSSAEQSSVDFKRSQRTAAYQKLIADEPRSWNVLLENCPRTISKPGRKDPQKDSDAADRLMRPAVITLNSDLGGVQVVGSKAVIDAAKAISDNAGHYWGLCADYIFVVEGGDANLLDESEPTAAGLKEEYRTAEFAHEDLLRKFIAESKADLDSLG